MDYFLNHIEWIFTIVGSITMFFVGKKSRIIAEKTSELQNLEKVREMEKALLSDAESNVERMKKIIHNQNKLIDELEKKVNQYQTKFGKL